MALIRIFRTRKEAQFAKEILEEGGFIATIYEDKFNGTPIQEYDVPARFRLEIPREDVGKAAKFLLKKLKRK